MSKTKVLYLYSGGSRSNLLKSNEPDTFFYGLSHLSKYSDLEVNFLEPNGNISPDLFFLTKIISILRSDVVISPVALPMLLLKTFIPFVKTRWFVFNINLVSTLKRMKSGFKRTILLRALRGADKILCLSGFQKEYLLKEGLDPKRLVVINYGVDKDFYVPAKRDGEIILSVGKDKGRDYKTFLEATKGMEKVVIVTSKKNLQDIDVSADVEVQIDIPSIKLRSFYKKARIVVVPLFAEGFDQASDCSGQSVVLDAMACGVPVIVSDKRWVRDYGLTDSVVAVPPEDPERLRAEIERLNKDNILRDSLSSKGREMVETCYNSQHMASQIKELI